MAVFKPIGKHPEKFLKQMYWWLTPASSMGYSPHIDSSTFCPSVPYEWQNASPANWTIFTKMLMMIRMKRGNASSAPKALSWINGWWLQSPEETETSCAGQGDAPGNITTSLVLFTWLQSIQNFSPGRSCKCLVKAVQNILEFNVFMRNARRRAGTNRTNMWKLQSFKVDASFFLQLCLVWPTVL